MEPVKPKRIYTPRQMEYRRIASRKYVRRNQEKVTARVRKWRKENPGKYKAPLEKQKIIRHSKRKSHRYDQYLANIQPVYSVKSHSQAIYLRSLLKERGLTYCVRKTNQGFKVMEVLK